MSYLSVNSQTMRGTLLFPQLFSLCELCALRISVISVLILSVFSIHVPR